MKTANTVLGYIPKNIFFRLLFGQTGGKIIDSLFCFYFFPLLFYFFVSAGNKPINKPDDKCQDTAYKPPLLPSVAE